VLEQASAEFTRRYGAGLIALDTPTRDISAEQIQRAAVIVLIHLDEAVSLRLGPELERAQRQGSVLVVTPAEFVPRQWTFTPDARRAAAVQSYWEAGGVENMVNLLAYLYQAGGGTARVAVEEPVPQMEQGLYHPLASAPFPSLPAFLAWYRAQALVGPDAPLVAVTFYNSFMRQHDLAHVDALIAELEKQGVGAVPIFGWPFNTLEGLLTVDGTSPFRLVLAMLRRSPEVDHFCSRPMTRLTSRI
jgi:cobaltochelatase CobN